jgi:hypothetical protein
MIHDSVEQFLKGTADRLHDVIHDYYVNYFEKLKSLGAKAEEKFAFTDDWQPTEFDDPNAMVRGVIDIIMPPQPDHVHIFELKTGKEYDDHVLQRFLYATAGMCQHPEVKDVHVTNIYLDQKSNKGEKYTRDFAEFMKDTWKRRFTKVREDTDFTAMPSVACDRCPFSRGAGGPCEF